MENSKQKRRICIIGAGPRGLVALRHLTSDSDNEVVAFEAKDDIGGLWYYQDANTVDPKYERLRSEDNFYKLYGSFQGSLYEDLTTNIPYFYMEFKDFSYRDIEKDIPIFINPKQYKAYMDGYAAKFNLRPHIHFNTLVKSVRLSKNLTEEERKNKDTSRKFVVTTVASRGGTLTEDEKYHSFDYIIVASGQYTVPYIPHLQNMENFKGITIHCKDFRTTKSEFFHKKKILILGGGASAYDLVSQFFKDENNLENFDKLIVCSKKLGHIATSDDFKKYVEMGKLVIKHGTIKQIIGPHQIEYSDGQTEEIDTLMYATGYKLYLPFFDFEKDKILDYSPTENRGMFIGPLYKKFVAIREPSIFFLGFIEQTTLVHIIPELQSMIIKYLLQGKLSLPSQEEMFAGFEEEVRKHLEIVGDLAHFFVINLAKHYPAFDTCTEGTEWRFYRNWLSQCYPNNDLEKAEQFTKMIVETKKAFEKEKKLGNYLTYKNHDYFEFYSKDFRNTTEFI